MILKPCPFCGSSVSITDGPFEYGGGSFCKQIRPDVVISCPTGCVSWSRSTTEWDWDKKEHIDIREEAIQSLVNKWNTRA